MSLLAAGLIGSVQPSLTAGDGVTPDADLPRKRTDVAGIDEKIGAQLPLDLPLRDENEKPITLRDCIQGKPTILVPMYYRCPMLCNLVLKGLVDTLREMPQDFSAGGKFNVVAVSFDYKEHGDLATAKKGVVIEQYGRPGAEQGWRFLTGSKEAIPELMNTIGYRFEFDKSFKEYNHPSGIAVPGGKTTLKLSLVEAADGKGGSLLDKLTLLCYRFEHMKGYSLSVLRTVQIGGVITVLGIALYVSLTLLADRRRRYAQGRRAAGHTPLADTVEHAATGSNSDTPPSGGTA
jgi:protein SCO1/2